MAAEGKAQGALFCDLVDKDTRIYLPMIAAFEDELHYQQEHIGKPFVERYFAFQTGAGKDHHRVRIDLRKATAKAHIYTINISGDMGRQTQISLPTQITDLRRQGKRHLLVTFQSGGRDSWTLDHRIHNASKAVEQSLKIETAINSFPERAMPRSIRI